MLSCIYEFQEQKKPDFVKTLPAKLKELSTFLGTREYFVGDHVSVVNYIQISIDCKPGY